MLEWNNSVNQNLIYVTFLEKVDLMAWNYQNDVQNSKKLILFLKAGPPPPKRLKVDFNTLVELLSVCQHSASKPNFTKKKDITEMLQSIKKF